MSEDVFQVSAEPGCICSYALSLMVKGLLCKCWMLLCGCRSGKPLTTSLSIAQAGGHSVCKQHAARLWLTRPRGVTDTLLDMLSQVSQLLRVCGNVSNSLGYREQQMNGILLCHASYAGNTSDRSADGSCLRPQLIQHLTLHCCL